MQCFQCFLVTGYTYEVLPNKDFSPPSLLNGSTLNIFCRQRCSPLEPQFINDSFFSWIKKCSFIRLKSRSWGEAPIWKLLRCYSSEDSQASSGFKMAQGSLVTFSLVNLRSWSHLWAFVASINQIEFYKRTQKCSIKVSKQWEPW